MKNISPKSLSHADAIKEIKREIAFRQRLYPNWIAQNKLDETQAARQIAAMQKALEIVEADNAVKNGNQGNLF